MRYILLVITTICIAGCSKEQPEVVARKTLSSFLDLAIHEFTYEMGSTENRWEQSYVTRELYLLTEMEFARERAFTEGFYIDRPKTQTITADGGKRVEIPVVPPKAPSRRSFWLPISPEGTYTHTIESVTASPKGLHIFVRFHMKIGSEIHSDQTVTYQMIKEDGTWRIDDVDGDNPDTSLRNFLGRSSYMTLPHQSLHRLNKPNKTWDSNRHPAFCLTSGFILCLLSAFDFRPRVSVHPLLRSLRKQ